MISEDEFIRTLVALLHRDVTVVSEEHVWFRSNDPAIMTHVWRRGDFYLGGSSERTPDPGTRMWADSLTPVKQWLVMDNFDLLRIRLGLEDFGITYRHVLIAPN